LAVICVSFAVVSHASLLTSHVQISIHPLFSFQRPLVFLLRAFCITGVLVPVFFFPTTALRDVFIILSLSPTSGQGPLSGYLAAFCFGSSGDISNLIICCSSLATGNICYYLYYKYDTCREPNTKEPALAAGVVWNPIESFEYYFFLDKNRFAAHSQIGMFLARACLSGLLGSNLRFPPTTYPPPLPPPPPPEVRAPRAT